MEHVRAQARQLLEALPTESDFDALCLDYFSTTRRKFTAAMDRTARITLLLEHHDAVELVAACRSHGQPAAPLAKTTFYVPHPLHPQFIGRGDTLARLREQLSARRTVALWGLGGVGKTQVAVAYANQQRDHYGAVLWIAADSIGSFEQGLFELARPLTHDGRLPRACIDERDPEATRRAVLDYLRGATDYLLICDNLDTPQALKRVWPAMLGGHTLITSRSQDVRRLGAIVLELGTLDLQESQAYLMACHEARGKEELHALFELAHELDGLPLALSHAAAYLVEHQSRYTSYLRQYRKQRLTLLDRGLPDDYPQSVASTWTMNIEHVERGSPASNDLLSLCGFLQPDSIPEELFARPVPALGEALTRALSEQEDNELSFDDLLKPLLGCALVERDRHSRLLSLHRLVQQAVLHRLSPSDRARWANAAALQLAASFPYVEFANWPLCRRYVPQVLAILEHIERFEIHDVTVADMVQQTGYFLQSQAQYADAEPLLRRAVALHIAACGPEHPKVATSLNTLGRLLRVVQRNDEAESSVRRALAIWENACGSDDANVAFALNNLGRLQRQQGKLEEAEQLLRRALAIRERVLGLEHRTVSYCLNHLAKVLYDRGVYDESEQLLRRALHIGQALLKPDDPDIAETLSNLGHTLHARGQLVEAEQHLRHALTINEQALPPSHPYIAGTRHRLQLVLHEKHDQGQASK